MRTVILGPSYGAENFVERVIRIIHDEYPEADLTGYEYVRYTDTVPYLEDNQDKFDMVLFPGHVSYMFAESRIRKTAFWEYISINMGSFYRALLELSVNKHSIYNLSIDTYSEDMIYRAYREINVQRSETTLEIAREQSDNYDYIEYLIEFHKNNFHNKNIKSCITGVTEVYKELRSLQIPCARTLPTAHVVLNAYNKLNLKYLHNHIDANSIVVVAIHIDLPGFYSIVEENELNHIVQKNEVSRCIYMLASRIDAAVIENTDRDYLLFTNKKIIEVETNNFDDLYFSDLFHTIAYKNISIGVGYGKNPKAAKYNAYRGIGKAVKHTGSVAYVIYGENNHKGPIKISKYRDEEQANSAIAISRKSGISSSHIAMLYAIVGSSKTNEFTSKELASVCNISKRNMDRILEKLVEAKFCRVIGNKSLTRSGRPTRIYAFSFKNTFAS